MRVEDAYIVPRARALIAQYGNNLRGIAKILVEESHCVTSQGTLEEVLRNTRDGRLARRRPYEWSMPWPYHLIEDRPCTTAEFRQMIVGTTELPPTPLPKEAFPNPPVGTKLPDPVTDATGQKLGDEEPGRLLEPKFEGTQEVPRDLTSLVAGFRRAQAEKKLHEISQTRAVVNQTHIHVPILIFQHTDVHWGSEDTDYDAIARHAIIGQRENTFLFMTGDLQEFAKLKHRGAVEGQIHSPTVQARAARSWLLEVWDSILAGVLGNHDMRIFLESGFDIGEYLFNPPEGKERVPFLRDGGLFIQRHGTQVYTHNIFHGDSSFGTRFNENHKGRQTARLVDGRCDVTWNGHTHNPAIQDTSEPSDDMGGARDAIYLQGGSYKVHGDDHARRRKYLMVDDVQMPAVITFPDIHLVIPFKRVETAVFFHEAIVKVYEDGGSIRDHYNPKSDRLA